jgi:hypothetical protein
MPHHGQAMPDYAINDYSDDLKTKRDKKWIDEAIASGPERPLSKMEMDAIRNHILRTPKIRNTGTYNEEFH